MKKRHCFFSTLLLVLLVVPARARGESKPRSPSWLHLSFEQRTRYETLNNPFRIEEVGLEDLLALRTRLRLELRNGDDPVRFVLELQDSRGAFDDTRTFVDARHIDKADFLQVQIQLVSRDFLGQELESRLVAGRFTLDLGKRRLVARNRMRNTTNAFDGVHWSLRSKRLGTIQTFLSRPVIIQPEKLDSSYSNRYFWGLYYENRALPDLQADVYYLGLHENDSTVTRRKLSTVGARLYRSSSPGTIDYEVESAWQLGSTRELAQFAHFQHVEVGYTVDHPWEPRLSVHYDYASGDPDPEDDAFGRFDTLFGARRFEYMPTGIYGPFFRSNLNTPGVRLAFTPSDKWEVRASYRMFRLAQARDSWVGSGLQDPTGGAGTRLGHHLETLLHWSPLRFLAVELGYSRLLKGSFLDRAPGSPRTPDSNFFYIETDIQAPLLPR